MSILIMMLSALPVDQTQGVNSTPATQRTQTAATQSKTVPQKTVARRTKTEPAKETTKRLVSFKYGSRLTQLNVRHWPLIGNPKAKYVFVEMFDYTCPQCRNTHKAIDGAFKQYGNDLAIVVLPVPLDAKCNSSVRTTNAKHAEACEVSRIAVAVWRCQPSKFKQFHDWMFEAPIARTAFQARDFGAKLIGKEKLDKELAKPYASQYIGKHVQLYQRIGAGTVPKLIFPERTLVGEISSPTTLVNMIEQNLGRTVQK